MNFQNATTLNARFLNTGIGPDIMLGCVIARPVFQLESEKLSLVDGDPWPIEPAPRETPRGKLPGDLPFLTGGIDVLLFGTAHAPMGQKVSRLKVDLLIGQNFNRSIEVIGDRNWVNQNGTLVPSTPLPFLSMPLTNDRSFGGKVTTEQGEVPWQSNPYGRGFYITEQQAEGNPLPNLENPDHLIRSLEDRPDPVGVEPYPMDGSLRMTSSVPVELDEQQPLKSRISQIHPRIFNQAHPSMIIPPAEEPKPGQFVEVTHVKQNGRYRFVMPRIPLHVQVELGDRGYQFPLHLSQIGLLPDEDQMFLSYQVVFKYRIVRRESRTTTLQPREMTGEAGRMPASAVTSA